MQLRLFPTKKIHRLIQKYTGSNIFAYITCRSTLYVGLVWAITQFLSPHVTSVCSWLPFATPLVVHLVFLISASCLHLCSYSLMRIDNTATTSWAHFPFLYGWFFNHYQLWPKRRISESKMEPPVLTNFLLTHKLLFNPKAVLVTWLKPFLLRTVVSLWPKV